MIRSLLHILLLSCWLLLSLKKPVYERVSLKKVPFTTPFFQKCREVIFKNVTLSFLVAVLLYIYLYRNIIGFRVWHMAAFV